MMKAQPPTTRHFTLIELMVVVAIIAVILGMTTPVFTRLLRGQSVDIAARMVSSQLMLARAEAIARQKTVAVFFPGSNGFEADAAFDKQTYNYTSFRTAFLNSDNTFDAWVPGTSWNFIPTGAIIAKISNSSEATLNNTDSIYTPKKDLQNSDFEDPGVSDGVSGITITVERLNKKKIDNKELTIPRYVLFKSDGSCNQEYYITICEGISQFGDTGTDALTNLQTNNMNVIHINMLTGKTEFINIGK